jgi:hypothetical protein
MIARAHKIELTPNARVYAQLVVMQILLAKIAPGNHWAIKLRDLLAEHPAVPLVQDGLPGRLENPADLGLAVGSSHVGSIYPLGTSYFSSQHLAGHNPLLTASM